MIEWSRFIVRLLDENVCLQQLLVILGSCDLICCVIVVWLENTYTAGQEKGQVDLKFKPSELINTFFLKNYSGLWIIQATHSTSKSVTKLTEYQKIAMTIGHVIKLVNAKYIINNILWLETRCTIRIVSEFMLIIVQTIMRCHIFNVLNCSVMDVALVSSWTPLGMALETPEIRHCSPGGPWHHRSPVALYS